MFGAYIGAGVRIREHENPCCGESCDLDLKVTSSIPLEGSRGGLALLGIQAS